MKRLLLAAVAAATLAGASTPASAGVYFSIEDMMSSIDGAIKQFSGNMTGSYEDTTARAEELPMAVLPLTAVGTLPTATMFGLAGAFAVTVGDAMAGAGDQVLGIMR